MDTVSNSLKLERVPAEVNSNRTKRIVFTVDGIRYCVPAETSEEQLRAAADVCIKGGFQPFEVTVIEMYPDPLIEGSEDYSGLKKPLGTLTHELRNEIRKRQ